MKRLGYVKIREGIVRSEKIRCRSCGNTAEYRVTFRDEIGSVVITLCKNCLHKEYGELKLQRRLQFPLKEEGK